MAATWPRARLSYLTSLCGEIRYFDTAAETKPLLHLWSLAIEEQFYVLWPLLLGLVWRRKWNFLTITVVIAATSFAINVYVAGYDGMLSFTPRSRAIGS